MDSPASETKRQLASPGRSGVTRIFIPTLATLSVAWLASCVSEPGKDAASTGALTRTEETRMVEQGERVYQASCSGCHGANARGAGPVAPLLAAPVPDLTLLAQRRGGLFPVNEIYRIIDGQADLAALGPRHMPIWGYEFFGDDADDEVAHRQATEKIECLVRFLKSIQRVS
jgi:mono/diheme cytochrome c family protein